MQIFAGIFLLGVLVAFHELGHFLFAKMLGVRVLVYSIGFGPKLLAFKKGDTEYRLSLIPLGGYVRMYGDTMGEDIPSEEKKYSFLHQKTWRKSLIALAGPLFNFILPVILLFFLSYGTQTRLLPKIGSFAPDSVAQKAGLLPGDIVKAIDEVSVKTFTQMANIVASNPEKNLNFQVERIDEEGKSQLVNLTVTPKLEEESKLVGKSKTVGRIGVLPVTLKPKGMVLKNSPLYGLGLRNEDIFKSINGKKVSSFFEAKNILLGQKGSLNIEVDRETSKGTKSILLTSKHPLPSQKRQLLIIERHSTFVLPEVLKAAMKMAQEVSVEAQKNSGLLPPNGLVKTVAPGSIASRFKITASDKILFINKEPLVSSTQLMQELVNNAKQEQLLGVLKDSGVIEILGIKLSQNIHNELRLDTGLEDILGISLSEAYNPPATFSREISALKALKNATKQTYDIAAATVSSFAMLITGEAPASQIGGPIMLFDVAKQAAEKGLIYYIMIMCMLSVNLGILNLIPIPALDGGHLLLFFVEAVQGKPLTLKTRAIATQIGFSLLLLLMVFALFNDLSRIFS